MNASTSTTLREVAVALVGGVIGALGGAPIDAVGQLGDLAGQAGVTAVRDEAFAVWAYVATHSPVLEDDHGVAVGQPQPVRFSGIRGLA